MACNIPHKRIKSSANPRSASKCWRRRPQESLINSLTLPPDVCEAAGNKGFGGPDSRSTRSCREHAENTDPKTKEERMDAHKSTCSRLSGNTKFNHSRRSGTWSAMMMFEFP